MSSSIYAHRSLQPTGPPAQGPSQQQSQARLNECFETIRQEFDVLSQDIVLLRNQRDDFENKVSSQVNELNIIRQSLYDLEAQHGKIRQQYEEEISRLRADLMASRQGAAGMPPSLGVNVGPGASGLATPTAGPALPYNDPFFARGRGEGPVDRDRDRDRDRERERMLDRDRDRDRDREREQRDRDRDRERDQREPKRIKTDRIKTDRPGVSSPAPERDLRLTLLGPSPEQFSPSMGPAGPGPSTSKLPPGGPGLPPPPSTTTPFSAPVDIAPDNAGAMVPISANGGFPDDLDPHNVPPELKKEGSDWFAVFNPKVKRTLDVNLVHTLLHESVVCCVRFSADGKFLATGCNRTAQIYDTKSGAKTCVLKDEHAAKTGDLYIRSVCFSPDGKFLATGAEDKQIRIWDIAKRRIRNIFDGHQQEIYSLDFSFDGRLIVSGSGDKTARIWDMADGSSKTLAIHEPEAIDSGVTSVAISPDGRLVAAGSLDTIVRLWDVATGALVERLKGHKDSVYSVAFTPDGKGLVSGSLDKTLKYWDVRAVVANAGKRDPVSGLLPGERPVPGPGGVVKKEEKSSACTMNFTGHKDYVLSVAVSHDGQWVVSGSKDRGVQFWDARTATVQLMLQGHKNSVISIDLSPAASLLATGSGDWAARIWSYNTI
ncbi:WD40 repeat-like protein [Artomyces pyxidatus]|uniref:WD40 repeat-like protein n=1 Tax=Artomyces pyxidatus TaxID=48021 RepID=A0ACB8TF11_9AGAM|nr:WD40 repeat-like protein [Artomyces pyxidatus]